MMPREILKNPEISTKLGHAAFSSLKWKDIQGGFDVDGFEIYSTCH